MDDAVGNIESLDVLSTLIRLTMNPLIHADEKYCRVNLENKKFQGTI
jgi:hypothetical protein